MAANVNENLVFGWSNQQLGATAGQTGYAQNGVNPAAASVSTAEQVSGGNPSPPGAMNVQGENSGAYAAQILTNPGYASAPAAVSPGAVTAPAFAATTVAVQNPTGLNCSVLITGGTVTVVAVAPLVNGVAGTFTTMATSTATPVNISVPPGGFVKLTYSVVPTSWVWVATN